MNRKTCLVALALSTSLIAACGTDAEFRPRAVGAQAVMPVGDLIASARADFALNNVALALERFRRASRLQPDNIDALNGIAACYDRMGRFDMSRIYYEKALAISPNNSKILHNFQLSLTMQGRRDEALALAREAAPPVPQAPVTPATGGFVSASGPEGVTVALPPLPTAPATPPSTPQVRAVAPKIAAKPVPVDVSPRLERLSLGEVELVTAPDAKRLPTKQPTLAQQGRADRVVQVTRAKRIAQTRTSSEWVFPEAPVTVVASASASEPEAARPAAPKSAANIAAVAVPLPEPVAKPASTPAVVPVRSVALTAPAAKPPAQLASAVVGAAAPASRAAAPVPPVGSAPAAASPPRPTQPIAPRAAARRASPTSAPRVQVLNAVGRRGLAARYTRYLNSELRPADARRRRNATLILYPAGSRAQAAALAKRLPFRAILSPTSHKASQLLLVLGSDALAFDNRLRLRVARA